jgi:putative transposase
LSVAEKKALVQPEHLSISISRQCELLGLARSSFYYEIQPETEQNLRLMEILDKKYTARVIDWYSRYVLSWELSNTMDMTFCLSALEKALAQNTPKIFNSDQGSQFTSTAFTGRLEKEGILVSQDGRGRALDNIFVERLWRSVKYEEVYLKGYTSVIEALRGLEEYFDFYNNERMHQSLNYQTPAMIHFKQP